MQIVLEKIKNWTKENVIVLIYFLFAVLIEMTAVFVVEGNPFITRPFLALGLLALVCGGVLFIPSNRARAITCAVLLILQAILDLVFSVIFDMTDQYFDLGMLNLRNDAFAILESIPVNFVTFYAGLFFSVIFLVFSLRFAYYHPVAVKPKKSAFFYAGLLVVGVATMGVSFFSYFPRSAQNKYDDMVEGKASSVYSSYGMIGNVFGEFGKAVFKDRTPLAEESINEFAYQSTSTATDYFGVSKDKNVVVILAESLEWYVFLRGQADLASVEGEYPNVLNISKEDLAKLYPNLTKFYEESLVMTNFHGREKTDIAEVLSIIGSYPTDAYINYEYADNTLPQTLPSLLKMEEGAKGKEISVNSFHNGFKTFYNRGEAHKTFGFEQLTDMYDMEEMSKEFVKQGGTSTFYNYKDEGERNLDSEMIKTAKEMMFPKDKRFYTYITTITMHGMYYNRANMQKENNTKLAEQIALLESYKPSANDTSIARLENAENLYYYMTTALEFDYMLGCMDKELKERGVKEDTMVVLFGDHNAYYQEMSNYVKGIDGYDTDKKFTDLYNVPLMLRDYDLTEKLQENGESRFVDKFTCTADIVPTMLDLLGVKYYDNLYYGNSVLSDKQSILYSRAYGIFLSDGILRRSVEGKFYQYDGLTETGIPVKDTVASFEEAGKRLVEKIKYCDYIFRQDHFGKRENYDAFQTKMKQLNGWV